MATIAQNFRHETPAVRGSTIPHNSTIHFVRKELSIGLAVWYSSDQCVNISHIIHWTYYTHGKIIWSVKDTKGRRREREKGRRRERERGGGGRGKRGGGGRGKEEEKGEGKRCIIATLLVIQAWHSLTHEYHGKIRQSILWRYVHSQSRMQLSKLLIY